MRLLIPLWFAFLTAISLMPLGFKNALGTTGQYHAWGHFFVFLLTAVLVSWNSKSLALRIVSGAFALAFGILLEGLERVVYHNTFEWKDVLMDGLGVLAGLLLVNAFPRLLGSSASARTNPGD